MTKQDTITPQLPELLPKLWRFALRLTRHTHDADDLVQKTCLQALEKRELYNDQGTLLSWLFSIQYNLWINHTRKPESRETLDLEEAGQLGDEAMISFAVQPDTAMYYKQVCNFVDALPETYRSVLLMVAVEGFSYKDAAQILGIPVGTVMSRLSRARQIIGSRFQSGGSQVPVSKGHLDVTAASDPLYSGSSKDKSAEVLPMRRNQI